MRRSRSRDPRPVSSSTNAQKPRSRSLSRENKLDDILAESAGSTAKNAAAPSSSASTGRKPIARIGTNRKDPASSSTTRPSRAAGRKARTSAAGSARRGSAGSAGAGASSRPAGSSTTLATNAAGHAASGQARYGKISNLQEEARLLSNEKRRMQRQLRERDTQVEDLQAQLREMQIQLAKKDKLVKQLPTLKQSKVATTSSKPLAAGDGDADSTSIATFSSDEQAEDYDMISGAAFAADDAAAQAEAIRRLAAAATKNRTMYDAEKSKLERLKDRLAESLDEVEDLNDELEEMEAEHTIEILKMEKEMDELENEIDDLTQQLADLEEKQADQDDKRRGSNQSGDGIRGPGGALAAQAMIRDRGTIDKLAKELDRTRARLVEVEDELRRKESELADKYEDELALKDSEINKLKRENRRLITAKGFSGGASSGSENSDLVRAQNEIVDLKMKMEEMEEAHKRRCEELESSFDSEVRKSYEELALLRSQMVDDNKILGDKRDDQMREKDEEVARVLSELKVEHVKVTQLQREVEYYKERSSGLAGTVVTSAATSTSSIADSEARKLQNEVLEKDAEIKKLKVDLGGSKDTLHRCKEEVESLQVKYKNACEELEHVQSDLQTLTKEKEEADRLRDAPNEAAEKQIENLKSRLGTTKVQLSDKKDELSTYEAKNRAMNIQVQESCKERDALEEKNNKLMKDLEKATESLLELKMKLSELDAMADLQRENERLVDEIKTKNAEISSVQSELSSTKGEVKALKDEMKSSRDELVKKTREAERYSSVAEGVDAVRDQLAKKDDEIAGLEQKIGISELTLEEMKKSIMEKEQDTEATNEKLLAAESEMAELKGRLDELNEENMKLINDIAEALNAAGNSQEATAVKKKAEAARATAAQKENRRGLGGFIRRMSGDFDDDAIEDMIKEKEDEPVVADLDDAIDQLKEKNVRIKELEEAAEQHEEALLTLKSDLVRLNASYKDDDYLNKKNIEKLRQENTMYAMQLQRMEQELAEYREMYQ